MNFDIKFMSIKLFVDTRLDKFIYSINQQSLLSFYSVTLVNNMFHSKQHFPKKYRKLICSLGKQDYIENQEMPLYNEKCWIHRSDTSCIRHIIDKSIENIKKLFPLYVKLGIIINVFNKKLDILTIFVSSIRSTSFLTLFSIIYKTLTCYTKNKNIFISQTALLLSSLAFQIETNERQKMINKYLTVLYINYILSQYFVYNPVVWKIFLVLALIDSISKRGFLKSIISILL